MASALDIQGVRKCFGKGDQVVEVLKKIDIAVAPGEFLILVGPSGCGKSTLLNIIAGLDEPTEGAIHIGSRNVVGVAPAQRDIAMVFQSYALYPTMTVADNIGFALEMRKVPRPQREQLIAEVAAMLQIEHLLDHVEHHEKDFAHAKAHTLHELDRIIHDYGSTPDLKELHGKVEHAQLEAGLQQVQGHRRAHVAEADECDCGHVSSS